MSIAPASRTQPLKHPDSAPSPVPAHKSSLAQLYHSFNTLATKLATKHQADRTRGSLHRPQQPATVPPRSVAACQLHASQLHACPCGHAAQPLKHGVPISSLSAQAMGPCCLSAARPCQWSTGGPAHCPRVCVRGRARQLQGACPRTSSRLPHTRAPCAPCHAGALGSQAGALGSQARCQLPGLAARAGAAAEAPSHAQGRVCAAAAAGARLAQLARGRQAPNRSPQRPCACRQGRPRPTAIRDGPRPPAARLP
jgi:hypothetical protein